MLLVHVVTAQGGPQIKEVCKQWQSSGDIVGLSKGASKPLLLFCELSDHAVSIVF